MSNRRANGRVDIKTGCTRDLFHMYDKIPVNQPVGYRDATEGIWSRTTLSDSFFSEENITSLQNGIRHGVYIKSNHKFIVAPQDVDQLKIIMRSVYLQNAMNLSTDIASQINVMNNLVLAYAVDQVYGEATGYKKYLMDVSQMYRPMDPPVLATQADKQLIMKPWF